MSATPDTPLSLREARQREMVDCWWLFATEPISRRAAAARRATDEALVRAVLRYVSDWMAAPNAVGFAPYTRAASAVLDAVEREETER